MYFFMLTNILTESTDLICEGNGALQLAEKAFHTEPDESGEQTEPLVTSAREWYPERSS